MPSVAVSLSLFFRRNFFERDRELETLDHEFWLYRRRGSVPL
jgi:hypothetical protein